MVILAEIGLNSLGQRGSDFLESLTSDCYLPIHYLAHHSPDFTCLLVTQVIENHIHVNDGPLTALYTITHIYRST